MSERFDIKIKNTCKLVNGNSLLSKAIFYANVSYLLMLVLRGKFCLQLNKIERNGVLTDDWNLIRVYQSVT